MSVGQNSSSVSSRQVVIGADTILLGSILVGVDLGHCSSESCRNRRHTAR